MPLKMRSAIRGNTAVKLVLLVFLLAVLYVGVEYRRGIPGTTIVDRYWAEPVVLDLDLLNGRDTPQGVQQTFHYLHHTCTSENSDLGDHVCWAPISEFNGIPAQVIAFFFRKNKLSNVRITVDAKEHPKLFSLLHKKYGAVRQFGQHNDSYGNNIVGWLRPSGIVAINDHVEDGQEAVLLWISGQSVLLKAFGMLSSEGITPGL